ncbi:MAG TPA: DUF6600 domain-containing protein [Acidobacteriaceae bacterium]|nr:DUF6600 domain-containing protein [Acidobacteriaceae bacterium]
MRHPIFGSTLLGNCLVLGLFVTGGGFALAQTQTTAPPPPPDVQPSLQQTAAPTEVRAVRLSDVQGPVQVFQGGEIDFSQAQLNMPVVQGMKFVTSEEGRAEIQFEDGSVARATPNSSLTIAKLGRNPDGSTVTVIEADSGLTYYELNGRAGQYTVKFGENSITPNDGSIFRIDLDSTPQLAVMHGSVHISNDSGLSADIHTNQTARFDSESQNEYQLIESVAANSWDQWNSDRDEALAELDQSATEARADTGNPDNPAWSDLDAYGDWYNVPGYGMGWTPSGVGENWDPYGLGSWGYYDGIGYTWISGYPWGWWPYRCGAWSYFNSFGWMWFPGNCGWGGVGFGGDWYPYAVIWTIPVGYHCPHRPVRVRHPGHYPIHPQPLIAVNRGPQATQFFRSVGVQKAQPRAFQYEGRNIVPIQHSILPYQGGPLGEGFTNSIERTNPGVMVRRAYQGVWYQPTPGGGHLVYRPNPVYTPPVRPGGDNFYRGPAFNPAPQNFGRPSGPPAAHPAPVMHAPAPAPAPAGHPHR